MKHGRMNPSDIIGHKQLFFWTSLWTYEGLCHAGGEGLNAPTSLQLPKNWRRI